MVLSIINHSVSASTASVLNIICQTPPLAQRMNLLWTFDHFPYSGGKSRQGAPVRAIHITASIKSRLSAHVLPGSSALPGKASFIRSHWSSLRAWRRCTTFLLLHNHINNQIECRQNLGLRRSSPCPCLLYDKQQVVSGRATLPNEKTQHFPSVALSAEHKNRNRGGR